MIEILPIKSLRDEDNLIFGSLNVKLSWLYRFGLVVAPGIVVTAPNLHLKTALEHFDFGSKEIFEQSLTLVKKEISKIPIPEILVQETQGKELFFVDRKTYKSVSSLWGALVDLWIVQIKSRLWENGFYIGITEDLDPQIVIFPKKVEGFGRASLDSIKEEVIVEVFQGKLEPKDFKKIEEEVLKANKKLVIPHSFEWILDNGINLTKVLTYTQHLVIPSAVEGSQDSKSRDSSPTVQNDRNKSTVKVFLDCSIDTDESLETSLALDGIFIASEKLFDLNKPQDSFEKLTLEIVQQATTFSESPVLVKLADKSEGMGKIRGALRLIHQDSLFNPIIDSIIFARENHKFTGIDGNHYIGHKNVNVVIPFVRNVAELQEIKRKLAMKNLTRKGMQIWMEIATPENVLNIESYLLTGLDGVLINLDELLSHLIGFDHTHQDLAVYKKQTEVLFKFLEDSLKILHKSKVPFMAIGSSVTYPEVLEFLVEKGVYGVIVQKYEEPSIVESLRQSEKKIIHQRS